MSEIPHSVGRVPGARRGRYVWRYTIEANGTSGDPVAPPPTPRAGNARYRVVDERLTPDSRAVDQREAEGCISTG